jgi:SLT domain-containing protein
MSIFEDMARQGGMSAKSIGDSFKNLALSSIFQYAIPMMFGLQPGAVSGARATGGRVYGGQSYLVGERGPEILTPDSAATITPRVSNGGGGKTEVTQNINFTTDVKNTVRAEVLNAAPHIVQQALSAMSEHLRRGHRYI